MLLNLLTNAASTIKINQTPDITQTPEQSIGSGEQFPQMLSQTAAAFAAGQYNSSTNVVSVSQDNNQYLTIGNEGLVPPRWTGNWAEFGMFTSNTLRYAAPFNSIRAEWQAIVPASTQLEVDVRASQDTKAWTLWETLSQSGQVATFDQTKLFLYTEYRVRLFSAVDGATPYFSSINLAANSQNLNSYQPAPTLSNIASAATPQPPTYRIFGTREGLVGYRTANGHIIQARDHFVSLPSWKALNDKGKNDYQVRIVAPNGNTATAPVWDSGPWNFKDDYWNNPRSQFKDIPVGIPQAEKAYFEKHNGSKNESGQGIYNPSGIDVGDGTWWDDLGLQGASAGWRDSDRLQVTFLWLGTKANPAEITEVNASNVGSGTATIQWKTSTPTTDWLEYGFDNYSFKTEPSKNLSNSHTVYLTDLAPNKTYHFRVKGKDIFSQESSSDNSNFQTGAGVQTLLTSWQNDAGLSVNLAADFGSALVSGTRQNTTYWSDNPVDNYSSGVSTVSGNVGNSGGLDVDFAPQCDDKGQNCSFGSGTGYKAYVQLLNDKGESLKIGIIYDKGLSPDSPTIMVEGKTNAGPVWKYFPANLLGGDSSHHFHLVWMSNTVAADVGFTNTVGTFPFSTSGVKVVFAGAARYKGDNISINFADINFSWGSVSPPPAPTPASN